MGRDYKPSMELGMQIKKKEGLPARWIGLAASVVLITSIFFLVPDNAKATRSNVLEDDSQVSNTQTTLPLAIPGNSISNSAETDWEFNFKQRRN